MQKAVKDGKQDSKGTTVFVCVGGCTCSDPFVGLRWA